MKNSVYIETSIISYLTARRSRDLIATARQQLTKEWWTGCRPEFELFASPLVEKEASCGDKDAAERRIKALDGIPMLELTGEAVSLAKVLMQKGALPENARDDALHIATAVVHGMDYLLTWNCRHIDNAATKPVIRSVCMEKGYACPEICTPEELGGENNDG
ncbi:MAG: type II toxin-antitoxin system VapC family toxin [Kiritimatiellales bacterium]|nr:type II toxin-antitoxin system VapC family toxin [Kiritimatiellales bacterium]